MKVQGTPVPDSFIGSADNITDFLFEWIQHQRNTDFSERHMYALMSCSHARVRDETYLNINKAFRALSKLQKQCNFSEQQKEALTSRIINQDRDLVTYSFLLGVEGFSSTGKTDKILYEGIKRLM